MRSALREIRGALDAYKQAGDEGRIARKAGASGYPPALEALAEGVEDIKNPKKAKIYFLRRLPRDPFNTDPELSAAATWGKRSYASPADEPREGDDVFDVYTLDPEGIERHSAPRVVRIGYWRLAISTTANRQLPSANLASRISQCCSSTRSPAS